MMGRCKTSYTANIQWQSAKLGCICLLHRIVRSTSMKGESQRYKKQLVHHLKLFVDPLCYYVLLGGIWSCRVMILNASNSFGKSFDTYSFALSLTNTIGGLLNMA